MSPKPIVTEGIGDPNATVPTRVTIEAVEGPGMGARYELAQSTAFVGSGDDADFRLNDPAVSRRHLSIELAPGGVKVKDQGSKNGIVYLGATIREAHVPLGGSLVVGRTRLRFTGPQTGGGLKPSTKSELGGLIGHSLAMQRLFALMERVGPSESAILILGETGVGKTEVARVLHSLSARKDKPFVVVDCAGISPSLIESELFGHAVGAFTGADKARAGLIEQADGGTLFLDEVGELSMGLQPKLLRVLESGEFSRVGETKMRKASLRIIAATHKPLEADSQEGRFRADLYYRIAATTLEVPPLRSRLEDIPILARKFAKDSAGDDIHLDEATVAAMQCEPWPGNVRELRNTVSRAVALGSMHSPPPENTTAQGLFEAREKLVDRFEKDYLTTLLARHEGNISAAARASRVSRPQFYRLLAKHGFREAAQAATDKGDE